MGLKGYGIAKQWIQKADGTVIRDRRCLVIALGNERTLVIRWKPLRIAYHSFVGCA